MDRDPSAKDLIKRKLIGNGRVELAEILSKHWDTALEEYAQSLWEASSHESNLEKELVQSFQKEFLRAGYTEEQAALWIESLERTRTLQTATHLTASEGPTFFATHHLALMGIPAGESYLVAAYSGVPYANAAWSGCLNFSAELELEEILSAKAPGFSVLLKSDRDRRRDTSERRISLIPGTYRDAQVFGSEVSEKQESLSAHWNDSLKPLMPSAGSGSSFSSWASGFCHNQAKKLFPDSNIVYFDINEVIRNYLLEILPQSQNRFRGMLLNAKHFQKILGSSGVETPLFNINSKHRNRIRLEPLFLRENRLEGQNYSMNMEEEKLVQMLQERTLCPGLFIGFSVLVYLNGLNCLGSFEQVEYLARFKKIWQHFEFEGAVPQEQLQTRSLSCGRMISKDGKPFYPLDLILGKKAELEKPQTFSEWMEPLFPRLGLHS